MENGKWEMVAGIGDDFPFTIYHFSFAIWFLPAPVWLNLETVARMGYNPGANDPLPPLPEGVFVRLYLMPVLWHCGQRFLCSYAANYRRRTHQHQAEQQIFITKVLFNLLRFN